MIAALTISTVATTHAIAFRARIEIPEGFGMISSAAMLLDLAPSSTDASSRDLPHASSESNQTRLGKVRSTEYQPENGR